jgi:hypothetical protein
MTPPLAARPRARPRTRRPCRVDCDKARAITGGDTAGAGDGIVAVGVAATGETGTCAKGASVWLAETEVTCDAPVAVVDRDVGGEGAVPCCS